MKFSKNSSYYGFFFLVLQILVLIRNSMDNYYSYFWFCDFAPLIFAIGFFLNDKDIIKGMINIGLIPQLIFLIDFIYNLLFGRSLFYITTQLFDFNIFTILSTLIIHLSTALAFLFTYDEKPTKRTIYYSIISLILIYLVTLSFTAATDDVNFVYLPGQGFRYFVNFIPHYTLFWVPIAFTLLIIPTQIIQNLVYTWSKKKSIQRKK